MQREKKQHATMATAQANGRNLSPDKVLTGAYSVVARRGGTLVEAVTARTWMARRQDGAGVVYASVWINGAPAGVFASGHGKAKGYGYHKPSAAVDAALQSAGVRLRERIDGCGDQAIRDALEATARAVGYRGNMVVIEHN